jgi:hypothetical protein
MRSRPSTLWHSKGVIQAHEASYRARQNGVNFWSAR